MTETTTTATPTGPPQQAPADSDNRVHPSDILLHVVVTFLVPMFYEASGRDLYFARMAAIETVTSYRAHTHADLIAIAQVVAYGLAALASLGTSLADTISISMALRLRGNANACTRSAEHNRRALEVNRSDKSVPPFHTLTDAPEPPAEVSPVDAAYEATVIASVADSQKRVADSQKRVAEAQARMRHPEPARQPAPIPVATATPVAATTPIATATPTETPSPSASTATAAPVTTTASTATGSSSASIPAATAAPTATPSTPIPTPSHPAPITTATPAPSVLPQSPPPPTATPTRSIPAARPTTTAAKVPPNPTEREIQSMWAAAMTDVAGEFTASLPHLPPSERKLASRRAAALSSCANQLIAGAVPPRPRPGDLAALFRSGAA